MKRKVLVFGASGEIGGRVANLAVKAGHEVIGVTRGLNSRPVVDLAGVRLLNGDKNDPGFIAKLASSCDCDAIIDSVPTQHNVELYRKSFPKVRNVFFCGSTGTYVPLRYMPADEAHPWREDSGRNFHQQSIRDALALDYFRKDGFPITIFRPTNIVGPGRVPLELWGGRDIRFYKKLKDGETVFIPPCRDILLQSGYNWDLASAFVLGLAQPEVVKGEIFIISSKRAITLGDYLDCAKHYLRSSSEIVEVPAEELCRRFPDFTSMEQLDFLLLHMCFNISKAEKILGYAPTRSTEEGLVEALKDCEKNGKL